MSEKTVADYAREATRARARADEPPQPITEQDIAGRDEPSVSDVLALAMAPPEPEPLTPDERMFDERAARLRAELPDFDAVVNAPVFNDALREALLTSYRGGEMAYVLAKNPTELERLEGLSGAALRAELDELEQMVPHFFDAEKAQALAGVPDAERDDSACSMDEYMRRERRRQLAKMPWE
jgi:hypothetical protein